MRAALGLAMVLLTAAVRLPDVTKGSIGGRTAVLVWPRLAGNLVESDGCSAHLVPVLDPDSELAYPCGDWFQPPVGTYRIWIEKQNLISPLQNLLTYSGGPFRGKGLAAIFDVGPAGTVQVTRDVKLDSTKQLRLLNLESHLRLGTLGRAFERRIPGVRAHEPVLMPSGRVIAAITDLQGQALALSRPFTVEQQKWVSIRPQPPVAGTDVLAVLARARTASLARPDAIEMTLRIGERDVPPDVIVSAADRVYGVWYGVDAPAALFQIKSQTMALPEEQIKLRPRSVVTLRRTLKTLPTAKVSVRAPAGAFDGMERSIEIAVPPERVVRQIRILGDDAEIEYLPPTRLTVFLKIGQWRYRREVDLDDHQDHEVLFELEPIIVSGTLYRGRDPAAGTVKYYVAPEWISTETDAEGRYRITLWDRGIYVVEIDLRDERAPPFREFFVEINGSSTRDFQVPDSHFVVQVTNADSGEPVPAAEVLVTNDFRMDDGPEQSTSQKAVSDKNGRASLPPLRPGSVRVVVRAADFRDSAPMKIAVPEGAQPHSIPIQLLPENEGTSLALLLPGGAPAAGAEIMALPDDLSDTILWQSAAGSAGTVAIPKRLQRAILLVRHPDAASLARVWNPWDLDASTSWQLSAPAPPLRIKATDGSGRPARYAHVIVWIDGIALRGRALRFVGATSVVTDGDGYWRAAGLGGQAYAILATRQQQVPPVLGLAEPLRIPWPDQIELKVVE